MGNSEPVDGLSEESENTVRFEKSRTGTNLG